MNLLPTRCTTQHLLAAALGALLLLSHPLASAAPGAHGPDGEHLDGPAAVRAASTLPRIEAQSETFELVAELRANELVILVDRFATNEPVLGAQLEIESGDLKAVAAFRAEQGDYVVTDAAMLKALTTVGEYGLVFTLVAGQHSDLLDATLVTARAVTAQNDHGHDHTLERAAWIGAAVAALGLVGALLWWRQRRRVAGHMSGAL